MSFFEELKRRNVVRVFIAYVLMSWVLLQGADFVLDVIGAPDWVIRSLIVVIAIGLPIALFFAWAFEVTPEGIKREADVDRSSSIAPTTGRKLDRAIIVFLGIAVILLLGDRFLSPGDRAPASASSAAVDASTETAVDEAAPPAKSIAVLPFDDLSQEQNQAWFADGLAEEILNALARAPDLQVSARTASFRYRNSELPLEQIAQELGVQHVLEGSVRAAGDRIRVTAQLIRAEDGFHLWSQNYDRSEADMISIQEDLARSIALALETRMDPAALEDMARVGTDSVEAYRTFLQGVALFNIDGSSMDQGRIAQRLLDSRSLFEQAADLDPAFAEAHFYLASWWRLRSDPSLIFYNIIDLPAEARLEAYHDAIEQAIEHAHTEADRIGYLASKALVNNELRQSIDLYERYVEARPNAFIGWAGLGNAARRANDEANNAKSLAYLRQRGLTDPQAAVVYLVHASKSEDPGISADYGLERLEQWPDQGGIMYQTHRALLWAGRGEEASSIARRYLRLNPNSMLVRAREACSAGQTAEAEALLARAMERAASDPTEAWMILKMLGREAEATEILRGLEGSPNEILLSNMLTYRTFDPAPFPGLMEILDREGVLRPPPVDIPFKCPPPTTPSIAVLPFVNMSADTDNEYFSDGVSEEILNVLADVPDLKVASRTSAFRYKGSDLAIEDIADELGVTHVLEGSVRKAGNQVRVTAQLIKADDGFHLWSDTYDRELTNIFAIQDEIAGNISEVLEVHLLGEQKPYSTVHDLAPKTYEKFLRARYLMRRRNDADIAEAIRLNAEVMAEAPNFPRGMVQQAEAMVFGIEGDSDLPRVKALALQALELEPDLALGHMILAGIALRDNNPLASLRNNRKAIELDPTEPRPHHWLGIDYANAGYLDLAQQELETAVQLDPDHANANGYLGYVLLLQGDYDRSIRQFEAQIQLGNTFGAPRIVHALVLSGNVSAARQALPATEYISSREKNRLNRFLDAYEDKTKLGAYIGLLTAPEFDDSAWHVALELYILGEYKRALQFQAHQERNPIDSWADRFAESRSLPAFGSAVEAQNFFPLWDELGPPPACRKVEGRYDCHPEEEQ